LLFACCIVHRPERRKISAAHRHSDPTTDEGQFQNHNRKTTEVVVVAIIREMITVLGEVTTIITTTTSPVTTNDRGDKP
jgi:hypothetical protein